jgi:hypothetical protein
MALGCLVSIPFGPITVDDMMLTNLDFSPSSSISCGNLLMCLGLNVSMLAFKVIYNLSPFSHSLYLYFSNLLKFLCDLRCRLVDRNIVFHFSHRAFVGA